MTTRPVPRRVLGALLTVAALALSSASAEAAPFQILKTFETALHGSAEIQFTLEVKTLGVWVEIPCIDEHGSCTLTFSNVDAGETFVLGDAATDSWMKNGGEFYIKEVTPPGWTFGLIATGGTLIDFSRANKEVHFSFGPDTQGSVTLVNYPPAPEPATLGMLGMGIAGAIAMRRRSRR